MILVISTVVFLVGLVTGAVWNDRRAQSHNKDQVQQVFELSAEVQSLAFKLNKLEEYLAIKHTLIPAQWEYHSIKTVRDFRKKGIKVSN